MNIRPEDFQASNSSSRPPFPRQFSESGDLMVRMESNRSLNILSNDEQLPDLKSLTVQPTNKGAGSSLTTAYNYPEKKKQVALDDNDFLKKILADEPDDDNEKLPSSQPQPDDVLVDNKSRLPFFPPLADMNTFQTPVSNSLQNKRRKYNPYDLEPSTPEIDTEKQRMMSFDMRYRILSNIDILSAPSCMDDSIQSPRRDIESPRKIPMLTRKPNFNVALHKMMHSRNPSLLKLRKEREYNQ